MASRVFDARQPALTSPSADVSRGAQALEAIARRAVQVRKELDAAAKAKMPQSKRALLNPLTSAKMIAGHYDHVQTIHDENTSKLQKIELGAKVGAAVIRRHDLSMTELEAMDVKALGRLVGVSNAIAVKECLGYAHGRAVDVDASYLETEVDVMAKFVGEQVREARAFDEQLKKSSSVVDRVVGHASAAVLDTVSDANAEAKQALAVADVYYTDPKRKDTVVGRIGFGATSAGEMLASTVTMPATIVDVRATDEERGQAIVGTAMMVGTMGIIVGGGPAWATVGSGVKKGAALAAQSRPAVWIAESGAGRAAGRTLGKTVELLEKAEARFEATAFAKAADRAKGAAAKLNPRIGPRSTALRGAAQAPRFEWKANSDGAKRSLAEAKKIAKKWGVEIPEDVEFVVVKDSSAFWKGNNVNAHASYGVRSPRGGRVEWEHLSPSDDGIVKIKIRESVLESDEAIVAVMGHEVHEIEGLRRIFDHVASISRERFHRLVGPGFGGNLHDQAWDVADALVRKMRDAGWAISSTT